MMLFFDDSGMFPILETLRYLRETSGEETVELMLKNLSVQARKQLNSEVSLLINGYPDDPFIDYLRMRNYIGN